MSTFTTRNTLSVTEPYRLDLTVEVLRRLASNAVDVVSEDGAYYRALNVDGEPEIVRVVQRDPVTLEVAASGARARHALAVVKRMLGVDAGVERWLEAAQRIPWLGRIAERFRGVRPPRYP